MLPACMPQVTADNPPAGENPSDDRLKTQSERITRLETELHEMRLLFTNQLRRIEEVAAQSSQRQNSSTSQSQQAQQPQQVVIMPQTPVVTHRWDQDSTDSAPSQQQSASTESTYRIQSGDTLSEIAEQYQVALSSLLNANSGIDPRRIQPGQTISIPATSPNGTNSRPRESRGTYTVQSGDTLSEIAENHQIPLQSLLSNNPGLDPKRLRIGKTLNIPAAAPASHSVAHRQTYFSSPPADAIQRNVVPPPPTSGEAAPANSTNSPAAPSNAPSKKVLVRIPYNKSLEEIAQECGTDVETLNRLNHSTLSPESRIPANNAIYVPDFSE
jgi:LysM repeat protein